MRTSDAALDEAAARRVLLVQAFETGAADDPQWTAADRAWATRVAREEGAAASPAQFLHRRAQHALQRLAPRDAGVQRLLNRRGWRWSWLLLALALGAVCGLAADGIGSSQRINLLAPPVWAVVLWNLAVYAVLVLMPLLMHLPLPGTAALGAARRWLVRRLAAASAPGGSAAAPLQRFQALWLRVAEPLLAARAAALMHAAAAALAVGLIGGLYLRGLVLDYRAGWQSTFLDAAQVHAALAWAMQPAAWLSGIAVPDVAALQALRVSAGGAEGGAQLSIEATAAPWIHLYAATLLLLVLLPRTVLALWSAARAGMLARRLPLPLDEPHAARLLREQQGQQARVQVLPHGTTPGPHVMACLQTVLAPVLGSGLSLDLAPATAYGDEDAAAGLRPAPGCTLRLLLVNLASTPEADTHGALVRALRQAAPIIPLLVLADEAAFRSRFATLPARVAERRAAWQQWAQAEGLAWVGIDLARPDMAAAERALSLALQIEPAR